MRNILLRGKTNAFGGTSKNSLINKVPQARGYKARLSGPLVTFGSQARPSYRVRKLKQNADV